MCICIIDSKPNSPIYTAPNIQTLFFWTQAINQSYGTCVIYTVLKGLHPSNENIRQKKFSRTTCTKVLSSQHKQPWQLELVAFIKM